MVAFVFQAFAPQILRPVAAGALLLMTFAFLTSFLRPATSSRTWRGRVIDLPNDRTWQARLYRLLYRD
jgi:hypothetical protein